jgi:hypothetical protein
MTMYARQGHHPDPIKAAGEQKRGVWPVGERL